MYKAKQIVKTNTLFPNETLFDNDIYCQAGKLQWLWQLFPKDNGKHNS